MVKIEQCKHHHGKDVMRLLQQLHPEVQFDEIRFQDIFAEKMNNPNKHYFVAVENDAVIGFAASYVEHILDRCAKAAWLEDMVIDEHYRNKGTGTLLLEKVTENAKRLGCETISLTSNLKREKAHHFYEKHGFKATGYKFKKYLNH